MLITDEQFKEWNDAITCAQFGNSFALKIFANKYPDLYKHMTCMLRRRTKIRDIVEAFRSITPFIYWGALTFNEEEDKKDIRTKIKQVQRFLEKFFPCYMYVEEYGEEEGRFHIHFFGIMSQMFTFEEMYNSWHSRIEIECLKDYQCNKKIKYVTKYAVKSVPRVHMNKRAIKLVLDYKKKRHFSRIGFECLNKDYWLQVADLMDLPF